MPLNSQDKYIWDTWFIEKGKELHAFYLQASKSDCQSNPEKRHNLASIGHSLFKDNNWIEAQPQLALSKGEGHAWDNLALWTGSILFNKKDQTYYMFYTGRNKDEEKIWTPREVQHPQSIGLATSKDLCLWTRHETSKSSPLIPPPHIDSIFDGVNWRDPYAYCDEDGKYHVFITARVSDSNTDAGGTIAYLSSDHIGKWDVNSAQIFIESEDFYQMEVPQVFCLKNGNKKRYYLLFSALDLDCSNKRKGDLSEEDCKTGTYYMYSKKLPLEFEGFPKEWSRAKLLQPGLYAGKLLNIKNNQGELWGFKHLGPDNEFTGGICDPIAVQITESGIIKTKGIVNEFNPYN